MDNLYRLLLLNIFLSACGGGGSENSSPVPAVAESTPVDIVIESNPNQLMVTEFSLVESSPLETGAVIESTAQTSHEIVVPDDFPLNSERSFNLRINRSEDDNQAAYLSLCSDYKQHSNGSYTINYESCLLRTSLSELNYEAVITVTNDTKGLVAALWFMNESKQPIITDWRF
jgi:hypothetical protein